MIRHIVANRHAVFAAYGHLIVKYNIKTLKEEWTMTPPSSVNFLFVDETILLACLDSTSLIAYDILRMSMLWFKEDYNLGYIQSIIRISHDHAVLQYMSGWMMIINVHDGTAKHVVETYCCAMTSMRPGEWAISTNTHPLQNWKMDGEVKMQMAIQSGRVKQKLYYRPSSHRITALLQYTTLETYSCDTWEMISTISFAEPLGFTLVPQSHIVVTSESNPLQMHSINLEWNSTIPAFDPEGNKMITAIDARIKVQNIYHQKGFRALVWGHSTFKELWIKCRKALVLV